MIECLSNPDWIKPQMDLLVYLQNIRVNCADIIDKVFLSITVLGEVWLPTLICAIVYWCIDFRAGIYLFSLSGLNKLLVCFLKMLACVYRPWILDERIKPSALAIPYATGYSFPSGHSAMSSSILGGCAFLLKHKFWSVLFICLAFLVGFSRLWLGVHSLQDVVVGLTLGFFLVLILNPLVKWMEKDSNRYIFALVVIDIVTIIALIYICYFNTYRIDYIDGNILVDPQKMKYHAITTATYALGLINGCYLCAKFFPFNPKETPLKQRIIRGMVGAFITFFMIRFSYKFISTHAIELPYTIALIFTIGLIITLIYPIIFTKLKPLKKWL